MKNAWLCMCLPVVSVAFSAQPEATPAQTVAKPLTHVKPAPTPIPEGPYRKWINEEVTYIITTPERKAFGQIKADKQRNEFIEQFWARRDPTPGTPRNKFREEHYRRLAYATAAFSVHYEGWKTDRGRIYILYGPPDSIDFRPASERESPAVLDDATAPAVRVEQWRYNHIGGIGDDILLEFAPYGTSGEYLLVLPMFLDSAAKR